MALSYEQMYLSDVQKNLGFLFQLCLVDLGKSPDEVQADFLASEIPRQIEFGNPNFLSGKSGYELALLLYSHADNQILSALSAPYYPQAEYWSGFVLAYCQWKLQVPFRTILENYPLERILQSHRLLHEADISKITSLIEGSLA